MSRAAADRMSDWAKVHQRTVDLLHMWIGDALSLDFSSGLLQTLESFLTSKVIACEPYDSVMSSLVSNTSALCPQVAPVHSRGERLLSMLQSSPRKTRVCGLSCAGHSSISSPEYEDMNSPCRRSSIEDTSQQVCGHPPVKISRELCVVMCVMFPDLVSTCVTCAGSDVLHRRSSPSTLLRVIREIRRDADLQSDWAHGTTHGTTAHVTGAGQHHLSHFIYYVKTFTAGVQIQQMVFHEEKEQVHECSAKCEILKPEVNK